MSSSFVRRLGLALATALFLLYPAVGLVSAQPFRTESTIGQLIVHDPPSAHVPSTLELRIEVSYKGLDNHAGLQIEAAVGQEVVLTFVWADQAVPENTHRLLLKGYELKTDLLNREHPTQTLRFVADRSGTFELVCDWRCEGHKEALQSAKLTVVEAHPDPDSITSTSLLLSPSAAIASPDEPEVALAATLTDAGGQPLVGVPVVFLLRTSFAGVEGEAEIAAVVTDARGRAVATYRPTAVGDQEIIARFSGSDLFASSEQTLRLSVEDPAPAYVVAPRGLDAISNTAPLVVAAIVLSIWTTFGYVLLQVVRIRRDGRRAR